MGRLVQRKFMKELETAKRKDKKEIILVLNVIRSVLFRKDTQPGQPAIIRIDLIRKVAVQVFMGILGVLLGIFVWWQANLNIFNMVNELGIIDINVNPVLAIIASGILVGSGTSPIHSIIKYAESKTDNQKREAEIAHLKASLKHHQKLSRETSQ